MEIRRLPAAAALAAAALGMTTASAATAAPNPTDYVLRQGGAPAPEVLAGLSKALKRSGVQAVLKAAGNRRLAHQGGCGKPAAVPGGADWWCFNPGDTATKQWIPQGVTTVSDAQDDELWGRAQPLLVSWYDGDDRKPHKSVRVSFVDPASGRYRHVLLVWPYAKSASGKPTYEPIGTNGTDTGIHAGGIAWFGNRLYVADTSRGLRVFDMRRILDLGASPNGTTKHPGKVGLRGDTYYGHGYRYVMPQVAAWVNAEPIGTRCDGAGGPVHSYLSIERSAVPDMLASGEYCDRKGTNAGRSGRLGLWPLITTGAARGDLVVDPLGRVVPRFVSGLPDSNIQGAAGATDNWWFTHNTPPKGGRARPGQLIQATWTAGGGGGWSVTARPTISLGPEDLSCWRGRQQLWTVAEHARRRALYAMPNPQCR